MDQSVEVNLLAMKFLANNLYEFKKGVRHLFMMTMGAVEVSHVSRRLEHEAVDYYVHEVSASKVNVFFGRAACVEIARSIVTKPLSRLTPEEDFMLGTLLGYDKEQQCLRFLAMSKEDWRSRHQSAAVA